MNQQYFAKTPGDERNSCVASRLKYGVLLSYAGCEDMTDTNSLDVQFVSPGRPDYQNGFPCVPIVKATGADFGPIGEFQGFPGFDVMIPDPILEPGDVGAGPDVANDD